MKSVDRWQQQLAERVGLGEIEITRLLDGLLGFCELNATDPDALVTTWQDHPSLMVRRRGSGEPNLAVESFLIHNGINVFGDIVCVAARPADLAEQGDRFVPADGPG